MSFPPVFTNEDHFFIWTVEFHNVVNLRLGKPVLPLPAARLERETYRQAPRAEVARRQAICFGCEHYREPTRTTSHVCDLASVPLWKFAANPVPACPEKKW